MKFIAFASILIICFPLTVPAVLNAVVVVDDYTVDPIDDKINYRDVAIAYIEDSQSGNAPLFAYSIENIDALAAVTFELGMQFGSTTWNFESVCGVTYTNPVSRPFQPALLFNPRDDRVHILFANYFPSLPESSEIVYTSWDLTDQHQSAYERHITGRMLHMKEISFVFTTPVNSRYARKQLNISG